MMSDIHETAVGEIEFDGRELSRYKFRQKVFSYVKKEFFDKEYTHSERRRGTWGETGLYHEELKLLRKEFFEVCRWNPDAFVIISERQEIVCFEVINHCKLTPWKMAIIVDVGEWLDFNYEITLRLFTKHVESPGMLEHDLVAEYWKQIHESIKHSTG